MPLSKVSLERLATCDPDLQFVVVDFSEIFPVQVVYGHRGEAEQHEAFTKGKSQVDWPNSKHNKLPSIAVDLAPLEFDDGKTFIDWNDAKRFCYMAGMFVRHAAMHGIKIRWGGDWDMDTILKDNGFNDLPHFELVK